MNALGRVAARSVLVSSVSRVSRASSSRVGRLRRATTTARRGVAAAMASADDVPSFVGRWTRASEGEPPRARPIDRATRRVRVRVATTAIVHRPRGRARPASRLRPHPNHEKIRSLPSSSSSSTQRASTRPRTSPRTASPPEKAAERALAPYEQEWRETGEEEGEFRVLTDPGTGEGVRSSVYPLGEWEEPFKGGSELFGEEGGSVFRNTSYEDHPSAGGKVHLTESVTPLGWEATQRTLEDANTMIVERTFTPRNADGSGGGPGVEQRGVQARRDLQADGRVM